MLDQCMWAHVHPISTFLKMLMFTKPITDNSLYTLVYNTTIRTNKYKYVYGITCT